MPSSAVQEAETVCVSRDSRLTSLDTSSYTRAKWGAEKGMRKLNTVHMPEPDNLSSSVWENKKNLPKHKRVTWEMKQKTLKEREKELAFPFPCEESLLGQTGQGVKAAGAEVPHW